MHRRSAWMQVADALLEATLLRFLERPCPFALSSPMPCVSGALSSSTTMLYIASSCSKGMSASSANAATSASSCS